MSGSRWSPAKLLFFPVWPSMGRKTLQLKIHKWGKATQTGRICRQNVDLFPNPQCMMRNVGAVKCLAAYTELRIITDVFNGEVTSRQFTLTLQCTTHLICYLQQLGQLLIRSMNCVHITRQLFCALDPSSKVRPILENTHHSYV